MFYMAQNKKHFETQISLTVHIRVTSKDNILHAKFWPEAFKAKKQLEKNLNKFFTKRIDSFVGFCINFKSTFLF